MAERAYTYDHIDAAMCIWEEITNPSLAEAEQPWNDYREKWGTAGLRDCVITKLAWPCHEAWERAQHRYEAAMQATGEEVPDPGSFDWEFVPLWIRECVDWSGEHPRVRGGVGVNARWHYFTSNGWRPAWSATPGLT